MIVIFTTSHITIQNLYTAKIGRKFHTKSGGFSSSHIAPGFWWLLYSNVCGKLQLNLLVHISLNSVSFTPNSGLYIHPKKVYLLYIKMDIIKCESHSNT